MPEETKQSFFGQPPGLLQLRDLRLQRVDLLHKQILVLVGRFRVGR